MINIKKITFILIAVGLAVVVIGFVLVSFNLFTSRVGVSPGGVTNQLGVPSISIPGISEESTVTKNYGQPSGQSTVSEGQLTQRKVIKNGSLSLLVKNAEQTAKDMQGIAERLGGFVAATNVYEITKGTKAGSVTVRVPASHFSQAFEEIKKLAIKVERENVSAQDITEQYIDLEARLKNLKAEEEQYLEIMKKAEEIQDILGVASRLSEVRGRIEQIEGQLKYLVQQVDLASISADLTEEAEAEVWGIRWRPLYVIKQSLRNMLSGLTGYADALIGFLFRLPVILLWLVTIAFFVIVGWKIVRWIYRKFLALPPTKSA